MNADSKLENLKRIVIIICSLLSFLCYGDDKIKRLIVEDVELLCRIDADTVDTISFSSIDDIKVASGADFLNRLDRILKIMQGTNIRIASEMRLYLGCKLPLEMKQTMYEVVSEHYAKQFARGNYLISSSGREYAHKLIGRGFFQDIDQVLLNHGYEIKAVFLEKVVFDRDVKQVFAFTDITLTKSVARSSCSKSILLSRLQKILFEEKDNSSVDSCVVLFHAEVFLSDDGLQDELQNLLLKFYPKEMSVALKSSGNVHNPKLTFLYTALKPAMKGTPSMRKLSEIAYSCGYDSTIHSLGGEKLQLRRKDLNGKFFVSPSNRIYGVFGFSARKFGWEKKENLKARIIDVDAHANILTDEIKIVGKNQYW